MSWYYFWIFIFSISSYFILTDESVSRAVFFISQLARSKYELIKWIILNDPRNPIVKYLIWKRSFKLAEQIRKELIDSNDKTSK
jgi:hypothetical protein